MSVLYTKEHTEQLERQKKFEASEQARTRVMDLTAPMLNGDLQVKSEFPTTIISDFWHIRIQTSNLALTDQYAETVKNNEAAVWVASGMDLTEFRKLKDAAFTDLDMAKHVQTHGEDSINSYFTK